MKKEGVRVPNRTSREKERRSIKMTNKKLNKNQILPVAIIAVIIIALAFYGSGFHLATIGMPLSGTTLGSLSHVLVQQVYQNSTFSGKYWFATLYANGGAQTLSSFSYSASQLAQTAGSNYSGSSSQVNNFNVQVLKNQLIWRANGGLGSYVLYTYSVQQFTGSFTFTNCNGQQQSATGDQVAGNTECLVNTQQAEASYATACENAATSTDNVGLPEAVTLSPVSYGMECFVVNEKPWANVYYVGNSYGNAATFNQTVRVSINGETLQVSTGNQFAAHVNSTGKVDLAIQLLPTASGGSSSIPAAPAALFVSQINGTVIPITLASADNLQIDSQSVNQQFNAFVKNQTTYYSESGYVLNQTINHLGQTYVGSLVEQPLHSNYQVNGTSIIFNDNNFQVITPVIQIVSGLPLVGITESQAECSIVSVSPISFVSQSLGTSNIKIQNNGNAGDCLVTVTQVPQPFYVQSGQLATGTLNTGQSVTLSFTFGSNQPLSDTNYAESGKIVYQACDALTGTICTNVSTTITESPVCGNGYTQVNGNCQALTTISVPTTSVCSGSCVPSTSTTTLPTCQPPAVFNESMYLKNNTDACWLPPNNSIGIGWYIVGFVVVIAIVYYIAVLRTKVKSGNMGR